MALIELDLTAQPGPALGSRPPAHRYRLPGLLVAALLAFAVGGAAPVTPMLWRFLGAVPRPGDSEAQSRLVGDRVYTLASDGGNRVTTAWQVGEPPSELWTTRFPARQIGPDDIGFGGVDARAAGDVVLLSDGPATTVVDAATGRVRWHSDVGVAPLAGNRIGLAQNPVFRAGTEYDQESGAPGALYFSATGLPHVEPPLRTTLSGLDLRTGATVWTAALPGSVNVFAVGGGDPAVVVLASDRLQLIDGLTGTTRRTVPLPKVGGAGPVSGSLVGGTLLVHYGDSAVAGQEVAYAAGTLDRRWQRTVPAVLLDPPSCLDVLCAGSRADLDVLDPDTGAARWRARGGLDLIGHTRYVIEVDPANGVPVRLSDPATGVTRVDLAGWRSEVSAVDSGDPLVLRRPSDGGASAFGVVLSHPDRVQLLGETGGPVSDCTADRAYVMCRGNDGLLLWAFRS